MKYIYKNIVILILFFAFHSSFAMKSENKKNVDDTLFSQYEIVKQQMETEILLSDFEAPADTVNFLKGFFQDEKKLWTSPFRIKAKRYFFWAPVLAITAIALKHDEQIYSNFKSYQSNHKWVDKYSPLVTMGGENSVVFGTSMLFYTGGLLFKNKKASQTGLMSLQALGHAGLIVTFGKLLTGRERPSFGNGISTWHWFPSSLKQFNGQPQSKFDAFPSGHNIAVWSVATVIAHQYQNTIIVPVLAYSIATAVGFSRVTEDTHWFSDVIIGGALGYTIGTFVYKTRKNTRWTLLPVSNGKNVFLSGTYSF